MLTMTRTEAIPYESMKAGNEVGLGEHPGISHIPRSSSQGSQRHPVHADRLTDDLRYGPRRCQDASGYRGRALPDAPAARRGYGCRIMRLLDPAPRPPFGS